MTNPNAKKLTIYPYIIAVIVFLMCLAVWPLGLLGHTTYQNTTPDRGLTADILLSDDSLAIGEFTPQKAHLESLSFKFLTRGQAPDGQITLDIVDSFGKPVHSVTLDSGDAMNYRWAVFPMDVTLDTEEAYSFRLSATDYEDAELSLYTGADSFAPKEAGNFYYNGSSPGDIYPAITYRYTGKTDKEHCLSYYAMILLFGLLLFAACRKFKSHEEITDENATDS